MGISLIIDLIENPLTQICFKNKSFLNKFVVLIFSISVLRKHVNPPILHGVIL